MTCYVPGTDEKDQRKLILSLQQLAAGRSNGVGVVTLTTSSATTVVVDQNCAAGSTVLPFPATSNAAAEIGNGTIYIPQATILNGSFTINHANSATTARTFLYAIVG